MVVLAVTWMAKAGRENEVTAIFAKLTEESARNPVAQPIRYTATRRNRAVFSSTNCIKTTRRSKRTAPPLISCNTPGKNCQRSPTESRETFTNRWVDCGGRTVCSPGSVFARDPLVLERVGHASFSQAECSVNTDFRAM